MEGGIDKLKAGMTNGRRDRQIEGGIDKWRAAAHGARCGMAILAKVTGGTPVPHLQGRFVVDGI